MTMNNYRVLRRFPGHEPGETLTESDFVRPQRAQQLMSQRYLALLSSESKMVPANENATPPEMGRATKKEKTHETNP